MATDSWARIAAASKRQQSTLQSQSDLCLGYEDFEGGEDESRAELPCPFCPEEFDVIGLCCHIDDEHPVEAKNGRRRRLRKGSSGSHSTLSLLKKELWGGNLQYHLEGSSYGAPSANTAPDPLLSSFINNLPSFDSSKDVEPPQLDEENLAGSCHDQKGLESAEPSLSDKDQRERAQRSEFVRELLFSTIFQDSL